MKKPKTHKKLIPVNTIIYGWIFRILTLVFLVYIVSNFKENPRVISVLIAVCVSILWIFAKDKILILRDQGIICRTTFFSVWSKDEFINYSQIDSFDLLGDYTLEKEVITTAMPGYQYNRPNKFLIKMKDNSIKEFLFFIRKKTLLEFADCGNRLIKQFSKFA